MPGSAAGDRTALSSSTTAGARSFLVGLGVEKSASALGLLQVLRGPPEQGVDRLASRLATRCDPVLHRDRPAAEQPTLDQPVAFKAVQGGGQRLL